MYISYFCSTDRIVNTVDKHSPDHDHTAVASWKLPLPRRRGLDAVSPPVRAYDRRSMPCSGNILTAQHGYPILLIRYSMSTSGQYRY